MEINKEIEEILVNCGALGYGAKKISNITNIEFDLIKISIEDKNSKIHQLLKKGRDLFDYSIDVKLFELARQGDIKALEKLEQRKSLNPL